MERKLGKAEISGEGQTADAAFENGSTAILREVWG